MLPGYFFNNYFFNLFTDKFSALLLYKMNVLDIFFGKGNFFNFCYIAKYWSSDRIKLLARNVRAVRPKKIHLCYWINVNFFRIFKQYFFLINYFNYFFLPIFRKLLITGGIQLLKWNEEPWSNAKVRLACDLWKPWIENERDGKPTVKRPDPKSNMQERQCTRRNKETIC